MVCSRAVLIAASVLLGHSLIPVAIAGGKHAAQSEYADDRDRWIQSNRPKIAERLFPILGAPEKGSAACTLRVRINDVFFLYFQAIELVQAEGGALSVSVTEPNGKSIRDSIIALSKRDFRSDPIPKSMVRTRTLDLAQCPQFRTLMELARKIEIPVVGEDRLIMDPDSIDVDFQSGMRVTASLGTSAVLDGPLGKWISSLREAVTRCSAK